MNRNLIFYINDVIIFDYLSIGGNSNRILDSPSPQKKKKTSIGEGSLDLVPTLQALVA